MDLNLRNMDLPSGRVIYPERMNEMRDTLLQRFEEEKKCPNIKHRLQLIAEGFQLLSAQMAYETELKTKALGHIMRNRMDRVKRLTDG